MNMMTKMSTGMIGLVVLTAHLAQAQTATYTGPNGAFNNDTWNNDTNWDSGIGTVPSNTVNVIVETGRIPWSVNATPAYTGSLTLQANAGLGLLDASHNALGTGPITMEGGSQIILRTVTYTFNQAFVLAGDARIQLSESTAGHNTTRTFASGFSGAYALALDGQNGNVANLNTSNAFTNLTASVNGSVNWKVVGGAAGALGIGEVTINNAVNLVIGASGAMTNVTALFLNGARSTKVAGENKLVMNANDSVQALTIDGFLYPVGTYGRVGLGTVDHEVVWISGNSILTVLDAPTDTTQPELLSINAGGTSHYYLDKQTSLTYTLTFNEPIAPSTIGVDDFENVGTAPLTIDSVTQTTAVTFNVVVSPTGAGTLTLRVKASIDDLFGNTLAAPVTDAHTVSVEATTPKFYKIYESFSQTAGSISGKAGGVGLNTWAVLGTPTVATTPTLAYGQLPSSGGQLSVPSGAGVTAYVTTTSALADAGLLADGVTLWFSFLYRKASGGGSNERSGWAFGTDHLITSGTAGASMSNLGNGLGMYSRDKSIQPSTWVGGGSGTQASGTTFPNYGDTVLVVGRIVWGATSGDVETLTLWTPDQANIPADVAGLGSGWSTTMTGVDQTQFDTISMQQRNSNGDQTYDEIRFGATFDEVMGIAPPPAGTVIIVK